MSQLRQALLLFHALRRPGSAFNRRAKEPTMPVSQANQAAIADVMKAAQTAVDGAYAKGLADGQTAAMSKVTASTQQDDADTSAAIEGAATSIGALTPAPPVGGASGPLPPGTAAPGS